VARRQHPVVIAGGFALLGAGILMLVLPGPGWVTIALGLAVLAKEYAWARWLLARLRKTVKSLAPSKRNAPQDPS
jgi:uncharacterized protein (TIGR02611 family)